MWNSFCWEKVRYGITFSIFADQHKLDKIYMEGFVP